ncbi:MAG: leucine-rich repeat domain-containing protein [Candidatus Odinarchaeota archaeon]
MTTVLTYIKVDGAQEQAEFKDDVVGIDLSGLTITNINLSPLASCTSLQTLKLENNQIQTIDLSPLSSCTHLEQLNIRRNRLKTIDLSPLAPCTRIRSLLLEWNWLKTIDLSPLSSFIGLSALTLSGNPLQTIDLSPLASCAVPIHLILIVPSLPSIDMTPIAGPARFTIHHNSIKYSWLRKRRKIEIAIVGKKDYVPEDSEIEYNRPQAINTWSFLYHAAEQHKTDWRVQQDILCAMGLGRYGFIDCDLSDLLLSVPADAPIEVAREKVAESLIEKIVGAVDNEGTTTGLNIGELSSQHAEMAKIADDIIELREAEMQRVRVEMRDDKVDLRELWLTAYGYEVLTALGMRVTTDLEGLQRIKAALAELGYEPKVGTYTESGVPMSNKLKKAILWIAQNRGRRWSEIGAQSLDVQSLDTRIIAPRTPFRVRELKLSPADSRPSGHTLRILEVDYLTVEDLQLAIDAYRDALCRCEIPVLHINFAHQTRDYKGVTTHVAVEPIDLSPLESVPGLCELVLFDLGATQIDLSAISALIDLERFRINGPPGGGLQSIDLSPFRVCKKLTHFTIRNYEKSKLSYLDLTPLSGCEALETFSLSDCSIESIDLSPIAKSSFKCLELDYMELKKIDLSPLRTSSLESLELTHNELTEIDLSVIDVGRLKAFRAYDNRLTEIDLAPLCNSELLEKLCLDNNYLTTIDLTPLAGKHRLRTVELTKNQISTIDITPLTSCENLETLFVDEGVKLISGQGDSLPPALEDKIVFCPVHKH